LAERADYDRVALGVSVLLVRLDFEIQQRGWSQQQVFYVAALGAPLHLSWEILSLSRLSDPTIALHNLLLNITSATPCHPTIIVLLAPRPLPVRSQTPNLPFIQLLKIVFSCDLRGQGRNAKNAFSYCAGKCLKSFPIL
jgi:hypothetical protein